MRLYSGSSTAFVSDTVHNRVTEMLREAFRYAYRHDPGSSEVSSWRNSLRAVSGVIEAAGFSDNGVILRMSYLSAPSGLTAWFLAGTPPRGTRQSSSS